MCIASRQSLIGSPNFQSRTGRKVIITVMEGNDLSEKDKFGKCDSYVKLQYGRVSNFPFSFLLLLNFFFSGKLYSSSKYMNKILNCSVDYRAVGCIHLLVGSMCVGGLGELIILKPLSGPL